MTRTNSPSKAITTSRGWLATAAATAVIGSLALAGCGSDESSAKGSAGLPQKILVGATLPLTGPGGAYGKIMQDGLQLGLDDATKAGMIGDSTFDLVVRDDQAQAGPAVSQTRELVNDGAVAIVSAFTAPPLAQLPVAARSKVPVFNGGGNDPTLLGSDYLWNDVLMVDQEGGAGMKYLHDELGATNLGILFENDYTPAALSRLEDKWQEIAGSSATSETVDQAATTAGPQLDKLLAGDIDALFIAVDGNIASLTIKELAQRSVDIPVMGYSAVAAVPEFLTTPSLSLYYTAQAFDPSADFEGAAAAAGIDSVSYLHETYYNIGRTIAEALKIAVADGLDPNGESIEQVLQKSPDISFEGCCGPVTYTAEHGVSAQVAINAVEDGKSVEKTQNPSD